ncbi:DNA polymerase III, subunit gamma and tau [Bifidobacterium primatium]|uniref:DNA-directed DNA polymerase n=1 Tax=Bifidobacterium primatium TaxID=2045438 RepID=A0A2M9H6F7_9BIFI|nr:DNA polymerase III subunit gamma and tau [Bifidobacterium primatium]PJM72402.1 DNA polymerase III, subunit gamma and tau [Bifidobacterium primatium]
MALALYRRYRPDTFDGIVGQDQVTIPLSRALDEGKLTHAYLFSGPRGCGKTSSARILARCVNCAKGPTSHPCGECESCRDLATGGPGSIDVVEIDAASHNGVDDARELRERAGFAPARDRYKIFILDEAHMVTQQGFNALLKIVEEPPEHVMFIFATTEPEKVIGTIRSRTHHYPFRLVPPEVMGPYLEDICGKEGIKPEPGVLKLAMRAGGGSMRDTLSVLDQLMVGAVDGVIAHDSAVALLGFTPDALIAEAIDAVIDKDGEKLYGVVQKVVVGGFDPRRFVEDLLSRVRDLLVLTIAGERAESVLSDDAEAEGVDDLRRQAEALGLQRLTAIADVINDTLGSMTGAISPRMRLELLAARLLVPATVAAAPAAATAASSSGTASADAAGNAAASSPQSSGAARGGFIGRRRQQQPSSSASSSSTSSQPQVPSSSQAADGAASVASADATVSASASDDGRSSAASVPQSSASGQQDGQTSASQAGGHASQDSASGDPASDNRTPDEKWDAIVAALPEDVRRYVNRDKVPRINLAPHPKTGQMRLWIKFDVPLSKYAFALAVAREEVDGTNKVTDILRAETRKAFGPDVALAPTKKMADGQMAPPWSQLPPQEQQRIKAELLQASLSSSMPAGVGTAAAASRQSHDHETAPADNAEAQNDSDVHRAADHGPNSGLPNSGPGRPPLPEDDPWAMPAPSAHASSAQSAPAAADPADDPWAQSTAQTGSARPYEDLSHREKPHAEPHAKHVAVPDLSDDNDPWATPTPSPAAQPAPNPSSEADPSIGADPWAQPAGQSSQPVQPHADPAPAVAQQSQPPVQVRHFNPHARQNVQAASAPGDGAAWPSSSGFGGPAAGPAAPAGPQPPAVDPDDDEYSMSDESLGAAGAMDLEELKKFFEVKNVEVLEPDDPRNPRNIVAKRKNDDGE